MGMLAALAGFLALQIVAYVHAGLFEYPLDDVYIHLAMASNITHGTYGVNAGEAASASSSILYPFLLMPFPDTEFQRLLPLFWNTLAVAGCGWVWGTIVREGQLSGSLAWLSVLAGPLALNMSGVGFTGMEAAPHVFVSLLIVLGLWRALTGRGVSVWLVAAAIAAPLLRYEGLALTLLTAVSLFLNGQRRAALVIASVSVGAVVAFSLFLLSIGLDALPGSILAKSISTSTSGSLMGRLVLGMLVNLSQPAGIFLAALVALNLLLLAVVPKARQRPARDLLLVTALAGLAHLVFGQVGWMSRYEPYILVSLLAAAVLMSPELPGRAGRGLQAASVLAILAGALMYLPVLWGIYSWNPRAIHLQQAQMARFAQHHLEEPVAVNDLGRVAWRNPDYVLDIWGLGNADARRTRLGPPRPMPGWAEALAAKHGIKAAMIYDVWLADAVGPDWVRVGTLSMQPPKGALSAWAVGIYATDPAYAPDLIEKLEIFRETLPQGAVLTIGGEAGA